MIRQRTYLCRKTIATSFRGCVVEKVCIRETPRTVPTHTQFQIREAQNRASAAGVASEACVALPLSKMVAWMAEYTINITSRRAELGYQRGCRLDESGRGYAE